MGIIDYKPIYQMSIRWAGLVKQAGERPSTYSLYDSSFFHHRRVLGASGRTLPCLTAPGGVLENRGNLI